MRFIIGGAYQNKMEAACSLYGYKQEDFCDGSKCAFSDIFSCKGIAGFHWFIKQYMEEENLSDEFVKELVQKNPQLCILSDEIGYGVVPVDRFERKWRELTGRICCLLAKEADTVIRVTAGIPMCIKGALPQQTK